MPTQLARIAIVAAAALTLAACAEQDIFAPATVDSAVVAAAPGFGTIIRPIFPSPEDFMDITAGEYHTCARKYNGNVYCWGQEGGPLGIATRRDVPTHVMSGALMIDAGANHTCALNTARAAFCWGGGDKGQLGFANGQYRPYEGWPIAVAAPITPPGQPVQPTLAFNNLSAGGYSTCGTAPQGTFCWGELGSVATAGFGSGAPFPMGTYNGFTSLAVGYRHACGTVSTVETYCWGTNGFGQSGVNPANAFYYPNTSSLMFANTSSLGATNRITSQHDFTCAEKNGGTVQCVGYNGMGSLGNGQTGTSVVFQPQTVISSQQLTRVSTGTYHACALDQNNAAWCWGWGGYGQLGAGLTSTIWGLLPTNASTPVAVLGGRTYKAIAAGRNHTCAISTDNHIYCWGQNNYRQLGTYIYANGQVVTNGYAPEPILTM